MECWDETEGALAADSLAWTRGSPRSTWSLDPPCSTSRGQARPPLMSSPDQVLGEGRGGGWDSAAEWQWERWYPSTGCGCVWP